MRFLLASGAAALALTTAVGAQAQVQVQAQAVDAPVVDDAIPRGDERALEELERVRHESMRTRRTLAYSVLVGGLVSVVAGGALLFVEANDQAWRFAGINTAAFGAINTVVGLRALHGITREEETWGSAEAVAARRTPDGLARARVHAVIDERRESVGHAINFGLGCAYAGVGGTAIVASQLGIDHPNRWLASGIAIGIQSAFLLGVDFIGMTRSGSYHRKLVEGFAPSLSIAPTPSGAETRFAVTGAF